MRVQMPNVCSINQSLPDESSSRALAWTPCPEPKGISGLSRLWSPHDLPEPPIRRPRRPAGLRGRKTPANHRAAAAPPPENGSRLDDRQAAHAVVGPRAADAARNRSVDHSPGANHPASVQVERPSPRDARHTLQNRAAWGCRACAFPDHRPPPQAPRPLARGICGEIESLAGKRARLCSRYDTPAPFFAPTNSTSARALLNVSSLAPYRKVTTRCLRSRSASSATADGSASSSAK